MSSQLRIQPCSVFCSGACLSQSISLDGLAGVVGHRLGLGQLRQALAVAADQVIAAVLAELLADRVHLLAQQELALAGLQTGDVVTDLVGQLVLGQRLLDPTQHQAQALDHSGVSSSSTFRSTARSATSRRYRPGPTGRRRRQHLGQPPAAEALEQRAERRPQLGRAARRPLR